MKMRRICLKLLCVLLLNAGWFAGPGRAATQTWSGNGGDNNWSTGANWTGSAPVNNAVWSLPTPPGKTIPTTSAASRSDFLR